MKKVKVFFIYSLLFIILLTSIVSCNKISDELEVNIGQSTRFTEEDINSAVECVKNNFEFRNGTLQELSYDEERSNKEVDIYIKELKKEGIGNIKEENFIVFRSKIFVTKDDKICTIYWVLNRENKNSAWKIYDSGEQLGRV